jgi:GNAT superfamily N-acetyltransferase
MPAEPPSEGQVRIRRGDRRDAERLRELTHASKAYWGYDARRVRDWTGGLDFSAGSPRWEELYVAEIVGRIVGWVALVPKGETCLLNDLWVEPGWIHRGIGARLFRFATARAHRLGARKMEWGAEPNSVGFYEKMGGRRLRDHVSEWGRITPYMGMDLEARPRAPARAD